VVIPNPGPAQGRSRSQGPRQELGPKGLGKPNQFLKKGGLPGEGPKGSDKTGKQIRCHRPTAATV